MAAPGPGQDRQGHGEAKGRTLIGTHSSEAHGSTLIGTQMIFAVNFFATSKMSPSESMFCSATRMAKAAALGHGLGSWAGVHARISGADFGGVSFQIAAQPMPSLHDWRCHPRAGLPSRRAGLHVSMFYDILYYVLVALLCFSDNMVSELALEPHSRHMV